MPNWPVLHLDRAFLQELFASQEALGAAWSLEEPALVIAEERAGEYRVILLARPRASGSWTLSVVALPPVRAAARVKIGAHHFRAPFDPSGTATLPEVPRDLLMLPYGPHLEVRIEPLVP